MKPRNRKGYAHPRLTGVGLILATALLAGCGSTPPAPTAALAAARDAVARAERDGARQYAGSDLDEAQQRLQQAEKDVVAEQMTEAERHALESRVAAELASARTDALRAAEINRELKQGAQALSEEMRRKGAQQ